MSDNIKKRIGIAIIIILILVTVIYGVLAYIISTNSNKEDTPKESNVTREKRTMESKISSDEYYTIKMCLEMYYADIKNINENVYEISKEDIAKQLIAKLNTEYIENNKLTEKNIVNLYNNYKYTNFIIESLYVTEYNDFISVYLVYGKQIDEKSNQSEDYVFLVELDWENNTYSIAPYSFIEEKEFNDIKDLDKKILKMNITNINADELNRNCFSKKQLTNKELVSEIFYDYRSYCEYDTQYAYKLLNDEYKQKRFDSNENGEKYLKQNESAILGNFLDKMIEEKIDKDYTQYICRDNVGNYFIITIENNTMNYNIMLDSYTIQTQYFTRTYNNSNNVKKAVLNLEKFKQMINLKDYEKAYNTLNDEFKKAYFPKQQDFENYIIKKLYESNTFEYVENSKEDKKIKITTNIYNGKDSSQDKIVKRFKVELLDEYSFNISFDI